jgi:HEAT repeat protein
LRQHCPKFSFCASRYKIGHITCWLLLVLSASTAGCEKAPPPVTDPAKAPWRLDPNMQIDGLKNRDFRIRGLSAFNLGNMGAKAANAIPFLEKLAKDDPNPKVRDNAQQAVDKIRSASGKDQK